MFMGLKKLRVKMIAVSLGVLLAAVTVSAGSTIKAYAKEDSGSCGDNVNYVCYDNGFLLVGGNGKMTSAPWKDYIEDITSAHIVENVTNIYQNAFSGAENLNLLEIGSSVKEIGDSSFRYTGLVIVYPEGKQYTDYSAGTFDIPGTVDKIENYAFLGCKKLKYLNINEGTKTIGKYAFENCYYLETVSLSDSLASIDAWAFCNCEALKTVTIGKNVSSIGDGAFRYCNAIEEIKIDKENPYYSNMNGGIVYNSSMELICYPAAKQVKTIMIADGVKSIGRYAAYSQSYAESICLSESVEQIQECAFAKTEKLKTIYIPSSVKTIGEGAFGNLVTYNSVPNYWYKCDVPKVYFEGSKDQFDALLADGKNQALMLCDVEYNHEHDYKFASDSSTCEKAGRQTLKCDCGIEAYVNVSAIGHDYDGGTVVKAATKSSEGKIKYVCKNCKKVQVDSIPKLDDESGVASPVKEEEIVVGKQVAVNGNTYRIEKVAQVGTTGEVSFIKASKTAKSITVLGNIIINNKTYKVTSVVAGAMKNNKKVNKLVIGKNVNNIGANAFYGCKKIKSIKIKTSKLKAKSVGKKAFANINSKVVIKVPKKKLKSYKILLKSKGIKKKTQKIVK